MKKWLDNYNDVKISAPEGFVGEGASNKGRNYSPAWGGQFQNGGTKKSKFLKATSNAVEAGMVGRVLNEIPGADTIYDSWNVIQGLKEGDPMKVLPNFAGALLPGVSGKVFEAYSEEYLPKTPKAEKEKFKAVMKGKRSSIDEMKKIQDTPIDWAKGWKKLKEPFQKNGGITKDDNGYWNPDNWGKPVEIGSNDITMQGVDQDLIGVSDEGDVQYMTPGNDYKFKGKKVIEYPVAKEGSELKKLDQLTNFSNYNTKQSGGWLDIL